MKRTIEVFLGEDPRRVGTLHYNQEGARESSIFTYDAEWLAHDKRFEIDPLLPLQAGPQFRQKAKEGSVFHHAIADTEPDGWGQNVIRRDHAKRRAAARAAGADLPPLVNSLDFLLEVDDVSRVGALRFRDEEGVFRRTVEEGRRATPPVVDMQQLIASSRAVELNTETAADLAYLRGRGTSLGGLRPKCSIVDEDGHLAIGKFPSVRDERAVTKAEVLALRLAGRAGIRVADARVVMSEDVPVAVVRRFDRAEGGRIPYVSAATLMGVESTEEHTYAEVVDTIRVRGAAPREDIEELWRRIAFSILINNVDDHLHNHGFLHVEREAWRLSPAFDVNPFPDRARELKTWISEETGPAASIDALRSAAPYFRITEPRARAIIRAVDDAVSAWRTVGEEIGMTPIELDAFMDAFEHEERQVAQAL
jgi:serine/threonine-protein kinase HipA